MKNNQVIEKFFDRKRKEASVVHQNIVVDALRMLFRFSPHYDARFFRSEGEYDANHKISINGGGRSSHSPQTGSKAASEMLNTVEQLKAKGIQLGDYVVVSNSTPHAIDVEVGGPNWTVTSPYYPFARTKQKLKDKHRNVT